MRFNGTSLKNIIVNQQKTLRFLYSFNISTIISKTLAITSGILIKHYFITKG